MPKKYNLVSDDNGMYVTQKPVHETEVVAVAKRILARDLKAMKKINRPQDAFDYFIAELSGEEHEVFAVLMLDAQHRVLKFKRMFTGSVSSCDVYPRQVVKEVLAMNSAACVAVHNHPSGETIFSAADRAISHRLRDALELVDCRLIDSVVVAGDEAASMAEQGML